MSYLPRSLCFLLLSISLVTSSSAETATFPAALANEEGRSFDQDGVETSPGTWPNDVSKAHSIYDSAAGFASPGPVRITKFNLRPDGASRLGSQIGFNNLKLVFGVTPRLPLHISGMFADNLNSLISEPVTVYDQSWESKVDNPVPPNGTRPFDFEVPLTKPFEFNPSDGNLLVEWVIGLPTHPETRFDFDEVRAFHSDQATFFATGVDPPGGGGVGGFAVVTQFEFESVPEPTFGFSPALIILGLVSRFRRKR